MNETMGEVKIKVRIINATDEGLFRRGELEEDLIRSQEVVAIVDTVAATSVVTPEIARELGLKIIRQERAIYANEYGENVDIAEPIIFQLGERRCVEEPLLWAPRF